MSNVVQFSGAMHPSRALHMRKLTEADLDAQIASNRARWDEEFERQARQIGHRRALSRPSVIPLGSSLLARLARRVRAVLLRARSPL